MGYQGAYTGATIDERLGKIPTLESSVSTLETEMESLQSAVGTPLVASTASEMTDTTKIYVYVGSEDGYTYGDWYYYDTTNSAWADGGVYNSLALSTDTTLSVEGEAADAAATGEAVTNLSNALDFVAEGYELDLTFSAGYIAPLTLDVVTSSTGNHTLSELTLIPAMSLVYVPRISKSASTSLLTLCDSDGTPTQCLIRGTSSSGSDGNYICYPFVEDSYVIFGGNTTMTDYMHYYIKDFTEDVDYTVDTMATYNRQTSMTYGTGAITDSGVSGGSQYQYTSSFCLPKGFTIEYWSAGTSNLVTLSEFSWNFTIVQSLEYGDDLINHRRYTAEDHMLVRLSARTSAAGTTGCTVLPEEKFTAWRIFYEPYHYADVEDSPLYGKNLTVMGDSLIYGNRLGNDATWITTIGMKYGMTYTNLGDNGNPVAVVSSSSETPMVERTSSVPSDTDIFVLLGGANDKRLGVPIGTLDSTDTSTFMGALNTIIDDVRAICPEAKLLFMTTYYRYTSRNTYGFGDESYAQAMIDLCNYRKIPCFDNFHNSGVNFLDDNMLTWLDESRNVQYLEDSATAYISDTHHFSIAGYDWIAPVYEKYLEQGSAASKTTYTYFNRELIEKILEINSDSAVAIASNSDSVTPYGTYVEIDGTCYFSMTINTAADVSSRISDVFSLPTPEDADVAIFYEKGLASYSVGNYLIYSSSAWNLLGARTTGEYTLLYGSYEVAE